MRRGTPAERFDAAADRSLAAWPAMDLPGRPVTVAFGQFPAATAVALNQFDALLPAWDLAVALGITALLADYLAETARTNALFRRTDPTREIGRV